MYSRVTIEAVGASDIATAFSMRTIDTDDGVTIEYNDSRLFAFASKVSGLLIGRQQDINPVRT
jgi:hypothetical protein